MEDFNVPVTDNMFCAGARNAGDRELCQVRCIYFSLINIFKTVFVSFKICLKYCVCCTFQGDRGGPVVHGTGDDAVIHGIASWGYACALPTHPGVFIRVTRYIDWINNQY